MNARYSALAALTLTGGLLALAPSEAAAHGRHRVGVHVHHDHYHPRHRHRPRVRVVYRRAPRVVLRVPLERPAPPPPVRRAPPPAPRGPFVGDLVTTVPQGAAVEVVAGEYYRVHEGAWYRWSAEPRGWRVVEPPTEL